jgi:hypothetical protein
VYKLQHSHPTTLESLQTKNTKKNKTKNFKSDINYGLSVIPEAFHLLSFFLE